MFAGCEAAVDLGILFEKQVNNWNAVKKRLSKVIHGIPISRDGIHISLRTIGEDSDLLFKFNKLTGGETEGVNVWNIIKNPPPQTGRLSTALQLAKDMFNETNGGRADAIKVRQWNPEYFSIENWKLAGWGRGWGEWKERISLGYLRPGLRSTYNNSLLLRKYQYTLIIVYLRFSYFLINHLKTHKIEIWSSSSLAKAQPQEVRKVAKDSILILRNFFSQQLQYSNFKWPDHVYMSTTKQDGRLKASKLAAFGPSLRERYSFEPVT